VKKKFYTVFGFLFFVLGFIGIFLPLLPTTPFWILSAYYFKQGSEKWHQWMMAIPLVGNTLNQWDKHRIIPRKAKILSTIVFCITLYFPLSSETVPIWAKISALVVVLAIQLFVWKQKSYV
jgi:hypothetical protein